MTDKPGEILIAADELERRAAELGREISRDFPDTKLHLIGVLRGSAIFFADLARTITGPVTFDFVTLTSYIKTRSSGVVRELQGLQENIKGETVIVVEDIVDTGITLRHLLDSLEEHSPAEIRVCTMLDKPAGREVSVCVDYVGFTIAERFVVGYGLDCEGKYRNLPDIHVLNG
ncbi:hypoxanthine phosphoribosyltransferase [Candidatus Hydrogenedentota bacterium]